MAMRVFRSAKRLRKGIFISVGYFNLRTKCNAIDIKNNYTINASKNQGQNHDQNAVHKEHTEIINVIL